MSRTCIYCNVNVPFGEGAILTDSGDNTHTFCSTKHAYTWRKSLTEDEQKAPVKREWLLKIRDNCRMTVSPSGMTLFIGSEGSPPCKRKWWLSKVRQLKGKQRKAQSFGVVLHSVCDRHLSADELGRDPATQMPVELYPEGWEIPEAKFGNEGGSPITVEEQAILKGCIESAKDAGYLRRRHGGVSELAVREVIATIPVKCRDCDGAGVILDAQQVKRHCKPCGGTGTKDVEVMFWGDVDYFTPESIEDHKTSKAVKWLKSGKDLAHDTPMLMYAFMCRMFGQDESEWPEKIELAHNQYVIPRDRDNVINGPAKVKRASVEVQALQVAHFWVTKIQPALQEMASLRENVRTAFDIADPPNSSACAAYGGCEFEEVCDGKITEDNYQKRFEVSTTVDKVGTHQVGLLKENTMSIFANATAGQTGNAAPVAAAPVAAPVAAAQ